MVAVAARELPPTRETYGVADERELIADRLRGVPRSAQGIAPRRRCKALAEHGVAVKVLTGDNELVTAKICREVGLEQQGVMLGGDVERMSDAELARGGRRAPMSSPS